MRFISESSPVKRHIWKKKPVKGKSNDDDDDQEFKRQGDYLIVKRDNVWHQQRERFDCKNRDTDNNSTCKVCMQNSLVCLQFTFNSFNFRFHMPTYMKIMCSTFPGSYLYSCVL
jgi:hypothetical protein